MPVPNGFGNVFAQVFGYSHHAGEVVRLLDAGEVRPRNQPRRRILRYLYYYGVAHRFLFRTRLASFQESTARRSPTTRCW